MSKRRLAAGFHVPQGRKESGRTADERVDASDHRLLVRVERVLHWTRLDRSEHASRFRAGASESGLID